MYREILLTSKTFSLCCREKVISRGPDRANNISTLVSKTSKRKEDSGNGILVLSIEYIPIGITRHKLG